MKLRFDVGCVAKDASLINFVNNIFLIIHSRECIYAFIFENSNSFSLSLAKVKIKIAFSIKSGSSG